MKELEGMGKTLIVLGIYIILIGVVIIFASKIPWLGKLPGDIWVKKGAFSFYFPVSTCIIISIILTFLLYLFKK